MKRFLFAVVLTTLLSGCTLFERHTTGGLQILTSERPSSVFLDGQYLEKTPFIEKNLKPGTYPLRIEPDDPNLTPYETSITLRPGLLTVVTWKPEKNPELSGGVVYEMEPLKNKKQAEVAFITVPDGAIIAFDDLEKEFSPITFPNLTEGEHTFEITLPSYETQKHTLNVVAGYRVQVRAKLAKLAGADATTLEPITEEASASAEVTSQPPIASGSAQTSAVVVIQPTGFFVEGVESLRVRNNPNTESSTLGYVTAGSSHPYLGESLGGWYKIRFEQKEGWVSSSHAVIKN
ncbi:MAG: PEGA domain-containing protein [bacterium]|nr:PEGA domain-containing protein [bacterium]